MVSHDRLITRPITLRQARFFVQEHHRHHDKPQDGLWAIALLRGDDLVGVAIAERPVSGEPISSSTRRVGSSLARLPHLPDNPSVVWAMLNLVGTRPATCLS
jgi:hypothetical protein